MYIEKINGPQDVKKLSIDELNALASEMRDALLHRASVFTEVISARISVL